MAVVPVFVVIMFAALLSSISEATASAPFAYIANGQHNGVTVIDTSTKSVVTTIPVGSDPEGVAVNTAGSYVYVANYEDNTVSVINTGTNSVVATIPVGGNPYGVAVNTAGTFVYVANLGGSSVSIIDTSTNSVVATIPVGQYPYGIAVNPAGTYVYTPNSGDNTVSVIDTNAGTVVATIPVGGTPWGVAVNHSGTYVYVANVGDGTVSVINAGTNGVVATIPVGSQPHGAAVNPAGTYLYVTNDGNNTLSVIDTHANGVVATVPLGNGPFGVSVTADGNDVYIANEQDNTISVISTSSNSLVANIFLSSGAVVFGSFLSAGTFSDVPSSYTEYPHIEAIYSMGITIGCGNGDYCPSEDVTRDQMAAFIIRALYGQNFSYTQTPYFSDVLPTDPNEAAFFPYVQKLKDLNITVLSGAYLPSEDVTRDQMAAFIIRALYGNSFTCNGGVDCSTEPPYFSDVTPATEGAFFPYIQKLYELGVTVGCNQGQSPLLYCPSEPVIRGDMAAFISRAFLGLK